jgi:hypothetical protein
VKNLPYTADRFRHMFERAVRRAGIVPNDGVTLHTLRLTAIGQMIAESHNVRTLMAGVGERASLDGRRLERTGMEAVETASSFNLRVG